MEKSIGVAEAGRDFERVLDGVTQRGDRYLLERQGEPVAAVVPLELYEQWQRAREAFFSQLQAVSEHAGLDSGEAEELADEAVHAVRVHT